MPSKPAKPQAATTTPPAIEVWPISRFKVFADNPRKHSDAAVAQFSKAIQRFGFRVPVLAKFSNGELTDGHFRLKAAQLAGLTHVPVMDSDDMTATDIDGYRLSVNKMAELAEWDQDPLLRQLERLQAGGELLDVDGPIGFDLEDFDAKVTLADDWDFAPTHDLFVVTITGSLPLEDEVRERLRGLEGVKIEASSLQRAEP